MSSPSSVTTNHCLICFKETENPRAKIWLSELNERVSLCSDLCLSKHLSVENQFQKMKIQAKKVESKQDSVVKYTQGVKVEKDLVIEDMEELIL